jgi:chaperonin GroEL
MKTISDIVGATLGPNGRPILIERQEYGLPHILTKDGVTVFRHLGFEDPTKLTVLELARDAANRTVSEAGDGTTTATVLGEAIVRNTYSFCEKYPKISPQKVVRYLDALFYKTIKPSIESWSIKPNKSMLAKVAKLSANGDEELSAAVMTAFDAAGDDGNISIVEASGPTGYKVETIRGYPISMGYEESCGGYNPMFLNDKENNRTYLENPVFVLYYGAITEVQTIFNLMQKIADAWGNPRDHGLEKNFSHNVVLVATQFSDTVLANLAANFAAAGTINVFPLRTPTTQIRNSELNFLHDLAAVTGANVFDPVSAPLDNARLSDLGSNIDSFEATRYRSTIIGLHDPELVMIRHEELMRAAETAESKMDELFLKERAAKLVGGVAKIIVYGSSNGELREKRDRVEDAVCAVRGASKSGCLPGGGWTLKKIIDVLLNHPDYCKNEADNNPNIIAEVLIPSLMTPIFRIFRNCGFNEDEVQAAYNSIEISSHPASAVVFDAWNGMAVPAIDGGILDSTPAVREAIKNSISMATNLGTLGGTIVFKRDHALELQEAMDTSRFLKAAETGE